MGRRLVIPPARALLTGVATLLAGCSLGACSDSPHSSSSTASAERPRITRLQLVEGAHPNFLTVARDGSLWISEDGSDAVAKVSGGRQVGQYPIDLGSSEPGQLTESSDGVIWFVGVVYLGHISTTGVLAGTSSFGPSQADSVGRPEAITRGPDGAPWFTTAAADQARVSHLTPTGRLANITVPAGRAGVQLPGIATGPDHAVWFTEVPRSSSERESIGRVSATGSYRRWTLPRPLSGLSQITRGPDGAMWFTEKAGDRIGRITMKGVITEFDLPPGTAPFDITSGPDGALWFSTKDKIGRVTTRGAVRLWSIDGARDLIGIAADPHGGFWLADSEADLLDRFFPPQGCCGD